LYLLLGWVFLTVFFSAREIDPPISVGGAALEHFGAQLRLLAVFFFVGKMLFIFHFDFSRCIWSTSGARILEPY
jgi:hypothetical protein